MTPTEILTQAAKYLGDPDSPEKAAWCREGALALAQWMPNWESEMVGDDDEEVIIHRHGLDVNNNTGMDWFQFQPFTSRDDLAPVLQRIADEGLWSKFYDHLCGIDYDTPELIGATCREADIIADALLAPPLALASAALATIEGEKGENKDGN